MNVPKAEATSAGATQISITGVSIVNPGIANLSPAVAARFGYQVITVNGTTIVLKLAPAANCHDSRRILKARLSWIFKRRGANGQFTGLFDELGQAEKDALVAAVPLSREELPVLGSVETKDRWFILTTKRMVWHLRSETRQLQVSDINDAFMDLPAMIRDNVAKSDVGELQIETTLGKRYSLNVEPGFAVVRRMERIKESRKTSQKRPAGWQWQDEVTKSRYHERAKRGLQEK